MRINGQNPVHLTSPSSGERGRVRLESDASHELPSDGATVEWTSGELNAHTAQLRQYSDVRGDRVAEVRQKLADGQYAGRDIAEKTADAILGSYD